MVVGACATRLINMYSTVQRALHIVKGAQTKFVDRCQKQVFHHDHREITAKSLVGKQCWTKTQNSFAQRFFGGASYGERDSCAAVRCGGSEMCETESRSWH